MNKFFHNLTLSAKNETLKMSGNENDRLLMTNMLMFQYRSRSSSAGIMMYTATT